MLDDLQLAWDAVIEAREKANNSQDSKAGEDTRQKEAEFKALRKEAQKDGQKVSINEKNEVSLV